MKSFITFALLAASFTTFAGGSELEGVPADVCKDIKINRAGDVATCKAANAAQVLAADKGWAVTGSEYRNLEFTTLGPIELGIIPDADTSVVYTYNNWLLDRNTGKKIGVLVIDGYTNYEMDLAGRVDTRYNLKGEVVSIELKAIR